jgi:hypothetical protein
MKFLRQGLLENHFIFYNFFTLFARIRKFLSLFVILCDGALPSAEIINVG